MADETNSDETKTEEQDELSQAQLEEASGGAIAPNSIVSSDNLFSKTTKATEYQEEEEEEIPTGISYTRSR